MWVMIVRNGYLGQCAGARNWAAWTWYELVRLERYSRFHHQGGDGGTTRPGELRLLIHAILNYQRNEFRDDATIMVLERRPSRSTGLDGRQ